MLDIEAEVAISHTLRRMRKLQRLKVKRAQLEVDIAVAEGELTTLMIHDLAKFLGQPDCMPIDPVFLPARSSKKCVRKSAAVKVRK